MHLLQIHINNDTTDAMLERAIFWDIALALEGIAIFVNLGQIIICASVLSQFQA